MGVEKASLVNSRHNKIRLGAVDDSACLVWDRVKLQLHLVGDLARASHRRHDSEESNY